MPTTHLPRSQRQDMLAFQALLRLGKTAEQASDLVAGMQATRARLEQERARLISGAWKRYEQDQHGTSAGEPSLVGQPSDAPAVRAPVQADP